MENSSIRNDNSFQYIINNIYSGLLILCAGAISHNWPLAASDCIISKKIA